MAIFSGLLGAYGLRAVLLGDPEPPQPPPAMITVPLAASDLPAGRTVALGDIGMHSMTREQMAKAGLATSSVMLSPEQIIGRTLRESVSKDKPFLTTSMYLEGLGQNITELLDPDERAVTIEVDKRRGGNLQPGTVVDVLFRTKAREGSSDRPAIPEAVVTLFEGVTLLSVERPRTLLQEDDTLDVRRLNGRGYVPPPPPQVTLGLTLTQANVLRTVEGRGEISLIARSGRTEVPVHDTASISERMTLEGLLGLEAPERPFQTEIYRAGTRKVLQFDKHGPLLFDNTP